MRNLSHPRPLRLAVLACALGLSCAAVAQSPQPTFRLVSETPLQAAAPTVSGQELHDIAVDAYVYAYPMVLMELTRRNATNVQTPLDGRAPMNMFGHKTAFPDARTPDVHWPSTDTLYSSMWYDVSREPLIVRVPDAGNRYYFLSLLDMWTDVYASRGTRTVGNRPQAFAIVGPYWQGTLPPGVEGVRSPTSTGWVLGHVQTNGPADYAAVNQFQSGLVTQPLSTVSPAYGQQAGRTYMPVTGNVDPNLNTQTPPADLVASMDAATFWGIFAEAVRNNPPHANDYPMLDRLRRIGVGTGQPLVYSRLDPAVQQALAQAGPEAGRRIADYLSGLGDGYNGWNTVSEGIGTYGTDYLRRAAIAYAGLGAGVPEDVMYPVTSIDSKGRALDGDEDYVLHFDKGQLPPVNAFWSLVVYGPNQTFVDNQANKYAIHSTDALKYNADGSLDIYIRQKAPGRDKQSNWLPTPKSGPFMMNMRLYWPRSTALDGSWAPPPVQRD
ncbi:hypothetical protein CAL29_28575 [Bordetella genomosp. 10]|uniref:DUF1254 domain-containing protein n=1 Tax=Bordetella genomosp. 10 TaxID=1416804 RepID=A0A261S5W4_9BORD|nr:DUF1254 domain-containing protein [Bordetella genomosp. 10]OZI31823.1 hypothetical protein CAL29_28575 [Bordetella genomosp. 10]